MCFVRFVAPFYRSGNSVFLRTGATIALLALAGLSVTAQRFTSGTLGVRVDVLVTDGRNPVAGLTVRDFELRDNGVVQKVDVLDAAEVPIAAVLALDTSSSTIGDRQADLIAAGQTLLDGLESADRAGLTTFSHAVVSKVRITSDVGSVRRALQGIAPEGRTAILDGVFVALAGTFDEPGRVLVVVCTDGSDTQSWLETGDVLAATKRSNAVVYAVTSTDARRSQALKDITEATGGRMLQVKASGELRSAFERILREFRTRYVLAYTPEGVALEGLHRIDVTVPGRKLTVNARRGYVGQGRARQP